MATLVFDYDGTLHDCLRIYVPAFRRVCGQLISLGLIEDRHWSNEELKEWLGLSVPEMWRQFAPALPEEEQKTYSRAIGAEMLRQTKAGNARLYPGVPAMLARLRAEGHQLVLLSSCKRDYLSLHREAFRLDDYFSGFYATETYEWAEKTELFPLIQQKFPGQYLIIGDRYKDRTLAERFRLPFIGCAYGYALPGELDGADHLAASPDEIAEAVKIALTKQRQQKTSAASI